MAKLDFPVNIQRKTVAVSERGFGTILVVDNAKDIDYTLVDYNYVNDLEPDSKLFKLLNRLFAQKPQPQEVAVYGKANGSMADGVRELLSSGRTDWFWLTTTDNSLETVKALSEIAQTNSKLYAVTINEYNDCEALFEEVYENTFVDYHDDKDAYSAEATAVIMSYNVGGKTAKFKEVQGVKRANVSDTQIADLHKSGINTYVEKLGVLQRSEGLVLSGEYLDIVLAEYWIRFRMEERVLRASFVNDKIPYTNVGIGILVGEVRGTLEEAITQGIVIPGQIRVDYRRREDVPSNEVALRKYDYIVWTVQLAGAIHQGQISGVLTYDIVNEIEGRVGNRQ
jgi:hypothetical protein|nr:MAG TPA: tail sheath protein [Caudoviricetes sp.]